MTAKANKQSILCLILALLLLVGGAGMTYASAQAVHTEYYATQIAAAEQMEACFQAIRGYKEALGIPLSEDDIHKTGVVGQLYTGITTTVGTLEAKRTTAWPDMAALVVRMLHEAGVQPGDTIGLGVSGSYPGMNLAAIAACESMGLDVVCIASVGSSYFGANDPELTFPEMLHYLAEDGIIQTRSAVVSMGGDFDVGGEMDPDLADAVRVRLAQCGLELAAEPDFYANLAMREQVYQEEGPIDCFLSVGGNWVALGEGEENLSYGRGVLKPGNTKATENSGLIQRYLASGIPVLHLMDMEGILADYGLPFDPQVWPQRGETAVYWTTQYQFSWLWAGISGGAALLAVCVWLRRKRAAAEK